MGVENCTKFSFICCDPSILDYMEGIISILGSYFCACFKKKKFWYCMNVHLHANGSAEKVFTHTFSCNWVQTLASSSLLLKVHPKDAATLIKQNLSLPSLPSPCCPCRPILISSSPIKQFKNNLGYFSVQYSLLVCILGSTVAANETANFLMYEAQS